MSLISLTVELPQYARTFTVDVPQDGSVRDVKTAVSQVCPGQPRVDGQRLIVKGRILEDGELVQQVWKENESRVVHLAVHPASWSKGAPEAAPVPTNDQPVPVDGDPRVYIDVMQQLDELTNTIRTTERILRSRRPGTSSVASSAPCTYPSAPQYIVYLHFKALSTLSPDIQMPPRALASQRDSASAKLSVMAAGRSWPTIFDEEFPSADGTESKAKYSFSIIDGKPFLQLSTPDAEPSPSQQHAIRVLSYTFPLLSIRPRTYNRTVIRQRTDIVQQPQAAVQIRALPIRALLAPLILLGLRTLLLLYFFSPARKPLFSILLAAWVIYEAWGAVRGALGDLNDMPADGNAQQPAAAQNAAVGNAGAGAGAGVGNGGNDGAGARRADQPRPRNGLNLQRSTADTILSRLARINLAWEEYALAAPVNAEEPSFFTKAQGFVMLFFLTLYPDIWKRRVKALREREGRLRAEAIKRRTPTDENQTVGGGSEEVTRARQRLIETHERRRPWVKEYIQRVEQDEWIDD
ncbi:hypothetical protein SCHPADRAFT_878470 [Schizopora paradoxa]|uniref:Ubiquitin-like domain-containing protein n=1 Tax=Schizopora paradoxa TaxID=27342 RepID=A0A0H2RL45_9AGAM|nr:hypothetical protein SCHPADRAFT_878470 [Schizopora paradoxa]